MTRQPAVQLGSHLFMTVDAKFHLEVHRHETVHFLDLAVAVGTVEPGPDVGAVVEFHVVGHIIDAHPGNGGFGFQMPPLLYELGMVGDDVLVAVEALAHRRDPGVVRPVHIGVAEAAANFLYPGVNPMAEINRLLWAGGPVRIKIDKIEQAHE